MACSKYLYGSYPSTISLKIIVSFLFFIIIQSSSAQNSNLFREYIGAEFTGVKLTDVPINPNTRFDFILAFAIDYTSDPIPTNGKFNIFWDTDNITPQDISSIKSNNPNVRVSLSIGGDSVSGKPAYFNPTSINSWVSNAYSSLKIIIKQYHLDGIDIDYEHFAPGVTPSTFAKCIGKLITKLKRNGLIKYASIAPFDDPKVQANYKTLWKKYGYVIDYVNFQFYAYDSSITVDQFIQHYETQKTNYKGANILISFLTEGDGGLSPQGVFFEAAKKLKSTGELYGIFVWSADSSKDLGFRYEKQAQALLAAST